jgi:exosome complex component RRP41
MVKYDFLTPENLRIDGRRPHEARPLQFESGDIIPGSDGSASVSMGLTKALAYVYGPRPMNKRLQSQTSTGVVLVEYRTATFSGIDRRRKAKGDRYSMERSQWIQKIFEKAILMDQFPRSQIEIFVEVIQQDGSALSAAINAVSLALVNAGIPLRDIVSSSTLGLMDQKTVLVDLNHSEAENGAGSAQVCLATYSRTNGICFCEVESKIGLQVFEDACRLGIASCSETARSMRQHILESAEARLRANPSA